MRNTKKLLGADDRRQQIRLFRDAFEARIFQTALVGDA